MSTRELRLNFTTQHTEFGIIISSGEPYSMIDEFTEVFAEVDGDKVTIERLQKATVALKTRIAEYCSKYSKSIPQINAFNKHISNLTDNEYFIVNPWNRIDGTEDKLMAVEFLVSINEIDDIELAIERSNKRISEYKAHLPHLINNYTIYAIDSARRHIVGESRKSNRICRFCGCRGSDNFTKVAHAIPEALGNKNLILGDECDACNSYFGDEVEPYLIEYFDIPRTIFGVKGKNGIPKFKSSVGELSNVQGKTEISSYDIVGDEKNKELSVRLGLNKKRIPQRIYKSLIKIAMSLIDSDLLDNFSETIRWVRYGEDEMPLPKVAIRIVHELNHQPKATLLTRFSDVELPHCVVELRLICFVFVFIVPFSSKDKIDYSDNIAYQSFWNTFQHYSELDDWSFEDLSSTESFIYSEKIKIEQTKVESKGG